MGDSSYFSLEERPYKAEKVLENLFSVFHVNIRSLNKNFEALLEFLSIMKNELDVIAISETCAMIKSLMLTHFIKYKIIFLFIESEKLVIRVEGWHCLFIRQLKN